MHNLAVAAPTEQNLIAACPHNPRTGLTDDQVLRMLLARQFNGWRYAVLAFHLADSVSYRAFCRVGGFGPAPSKSALAANLRRVPPQTLATLNALLVTRPTFRTFRTRYRTTSSAGGSEDRRLHCTRRTSTSR